MIEYTIVTHVRSVYKGIWGIMNGIRKRNRAVETLWI